MKKKDQQIFGFICSISISHLGSFTKQKRKLRNYLQICWILELVKWGANLRLYFEICCVCASELTDCYLLTQLDYLKANDQDTVLLN